MPDPLHLHQTVAFLRQIGLEVIEAEEASGFLEDIRIEQGRLYYRPSAHASNLLHEAGHLAVLPSRFRPLAGDDLQKVFILMHDEVGQLIQKPDCDPDAPEIREVMQAGETEATAWAFAAGRAIGLPDTITIRDEDYDGEGESVRTGLICNAYFGINGLVAGGMCASVRSYPTLTRWLQH